MSNFDCLLESLQQYADSATADSAAKARGFAKVVGHGNFVIGLKCAVVVLELLDNLNRAVQAKYSSMASMTTAVQTKVQALNQLRSDDTFRALYADAVVLCRDADVELPEPPRYRRPPRRLSGPTVAHRPMGTSAEEYFRSQIF